jgi:hypothetical protein
LKKSREMTKLFERVRQFFLERLRFWSFSFITIDFPLPLYSSIVLFSSKSSLSILPEIDPVKNSSFPYSQSRWMALPIYRVHVMGLTYQCILFP